MQSHSSAPTSAHPSLPPPVPMATPAAIPPSRYPIAADTFHSPTGSQYQGAPPEHAFGGPYPMYNLPSAGGSGPCCPSSWSPTLTVLPVFFQSTRLRLFLGRISRLCVICTDRIVSKRSPLASVSHRSSASSSTSCTRSRRVCTRCVCKRGPLRVCTDTPLSSAILPRRLCRTARRVRPALLRPSHEHRRKYTCAGAEEVRSIVHIEILPLTGLAVTATCRWNARPSANSLKSVTKPAGMSQLGRTTRP